MDIDKIEQALEVGDFDRADLLLRSSSNGGTLTSASLHRLQSVYIDSGQPARWVAALLHNDSKIWRRISAVARVGEACTDEAAFAEYSRLVADRATEDQHLSISVGDQLRGFSERVRKAVVPLKYRGLDVSSSNEETFRQASVLGKRMRFSGSGLKYLFQHSRCRNMSWDDWLRDVRQANAVAQIIGDRLIPIEATSELCDFSDVGRLGRIDPEQSTMVLLAHVGFGEMLSVLLARDFPDMLLVSRSGNSNVLPAVLVDEQPVGAMMSAYKLLVANGVVGMAPDGPYGENTAQIKVLGCPLTVRTGAAAIAYEAACQTASYAIDFNGRRFKPVWRLGPKRRQKESLEAFTVRVLSFYEKSLNAHFSGRPMNLALLPRWLKFFNQAATQQ